jgi:flagellar biosynthesis component FlhA
MDILSWIISVYTTPLGDAFWGVVLWGVSYPFYARTRNITFVMSLVLILATVIQPLFPPSVLDAAKILTILGVTALMYTFFIGRRFDV